MSGRCMVWGLVLLLVASMIWLHITVVYDESPEASMASPGRGAPAKVPKLSPRAQPHRERRSR